MKLTGILIVVTLVFIGCGEPTNKKTTDDLVRQEAIDQLKTNLRTQPKLVKVHAAEFLMWLKLDEPGEVQKIFTVEQDRFGTEPLYRIPVWRILAQTETDQQKKQQWVDKILNAWYDTTATDRVSAAESLGKIKVSVLEKYPWETRQVLEGEPSPLLVYTNWSAAIGLKDPDSVRNNRVSFLGLTAPGQNEHVRGVAAYCLRHLGQITDSEWHQLAESALTVFSKPEFQIYLLSSVYVNTPEDSLSSQTYKNIRTRLLDNKNSSRKDDRMEMAAALSVKGTQDDLPVLISLLRNENPVTGADSAVVNSGNADVRSVAAYAILKIARRYDPVQKKDQ